MTRNGDALGMGMGQMLGLLLIVNLILFVIILIGFWRMFVKASQPGWAIVVPYYNVIVLHNILGLPMKWFFYFIALNIIVIVSESLNLMFFTSFIVVIYTVYGWFLVRLSLRAFGRNDGIVATTIAFLLPLIFVYHVGYSRAIYVGKPSLHDLPNLPWVGR